MTSNNIPSSFEFDIAPGHLNYNDNQALKILVQQIENLSFSFEKTIDNYLVVQFGSMTEKGDDLYQQSGTIKYDVSDLSSSIKHHFKLNWELNGQQTFISLSIDDQEIEKVELKELISPFSPYDFKQYLIRKKITDNRLQTIFAEVQSLSSKIGDKDKIPPIVNNFLQRYQNVVRMDAALAFGDNIDMVQNQLDFPYNDLIKELTELKDKS